MLAGFTGPPSQMPSPVPRCGPCLGCWRARGCPSPSSASTLPACVPAAKCWVSAAAGSACSAPVPAGTCRLDGAWMLLLPSPGPAPCTFATLGRLLQQLSSLPAVAAPHCLYTRAAHTALGLPVLQGRTRCRRSWRASWTGRSSPPPSSSRPPWCCPSTGRCCSPTRVRRATRAAALAVRGLHCGLCTGPCGRASLEVACSPSSAVHQQPPGPLSQTCRLCPLHPTQNVCAPAPQASAWTPGSTPT